MNLGIIAASNATLRLLFVNLGPIMVQVPSDFPTRRPFVMMQRNLEVLKIGRKLRSVVLNPLDVRKTTEAGVS